MGTKYTFTFGREEENKFRGILARLEDHEYTVHKDITVIEDSKYSERDWKREAIIEMEPESCLTFRLGMKEVKIRRERTEEELAEEKALHDANTVKITVKVDPSLLPPGAVPPTTTP